MEKNQIDLLSIITLVISVLIAFISPSIPSLSKQTIAIILTSVFILLVLLLLIIVYLNMSKRIGILENKNEKLKSLEEKFKTVSDLSYMKGRLDTIEKKVFSK